MNTSSKPNMEEVYTTLSQIKQVNPERDLYQEILAKVSQKKIIPLFWVRVAACLLVLITSTEFILISKNQHQKTLTKMGIETQNMLYHD